MERGSFHAKFFAPSQEGKKQNNFLLSSSLLNSEEVEDSTRGFIKGTYSNTFSYLDEKEIAYIFKIEDGCVKLDRKVDLMQFGYAEHVWLADRYLAVFNDPDAILNIHDMSTENYDIVASFDHTYCMRDMNVGTLFYVDSQDSFKVCIIDEEGEFKMLEAPVISHTVSPFCVAVSEPTIGYFVDGDLVLISLRENEIVTEVKKGYGVNYEPAPDDAFFFGDTAFYSSGEHSVVAVDSNLNQLQEVSGIELDFVMYQDGSIFAAVNDRFVQLQYEQTDAMFGIAKNGDVKMVEFGSTPYPTFFTPSQICVFDISGPIKRMVVFSDHKSESESILEEICSYRYSDIFKFYYILESKDSHLTAHSISEGPLPNLISPSMMEHYTESAEIVLNDSFAAMVSPESELIVIGDDFIRRLESVPSTPCVIAGNYCWVAGMWFVSIFQVNPTTKQVEQHIDEIFAFEIVPEDITVNSFNPQQSCICTVEGCYLLIYSSETNSIEKYQIPNTAPDDEDIYNEDMLDEILFIDDNTFICAKRFFRFDNVKKEVIMCECAWDVDYLSFYHVSCSRRLEIIVYNEWLDVFDIVMNVTKLSADLMEFRTEERHINILELNELESITAVTGFKAISEGLIYFG
ncbi:hypothetical protein PCE1_001277 [Barthelona sp. PCE]